MGGDYIGEFGGECVSSSIIGVGCLIVAFYGFDEKGGGCFEVWGWL